MKTCKKCGAENPNKAIFCLSCGERNSFNLFTKKEKKDPSGIPMRIIEEISKKIKPYEGLFYYEKGARVWGKNSIFWNTLVTGAPYVSMMPGPGQGTKEVEEGEKQILKFAKKMHKKEGAECYLRLNGFGTLLLSVVLEKEDYLFEIGHFWIPIRTKLGSKLLPFLSPKAKEDFLKQNLRAIQNCQNQISYYQNDMKSLKRINNLLQKQGAFVIPIINKEEE